MTITVWSAQCEHKDESSTVTIKFAKTPRSGSSFQNSKGPVRRRTKYRSRKGLCRPPLLGSAWPTSCCASVVYECECECACRDLAPQPKETRPYERPRMPVWW